MKEGTPQKRKKFTRKPLTPNSKQYLRRVYEHHFVKDTLPTKKEALKILSSQDAPVTLKRFSWIKQKEFVRSAQIALRRQAAKEGEDFF